LLNAIFTKLKLIDHKTYELMHNNIKFKRSQGTYFSTILKHVLCYNFPEGNEDENKFTETYWPWDNYISLGNFIDILKEALTLWSHAYKMVDELTEKARIDHLNIAFNNADFFLKSKIKKLGLSELF